MIQLGCSSCISTQILGSFDRCMQEYHSFREERYLGGRNNKDSTKSATKNPCKAQKNIDIIMPMSYNVESPLFDGKVWQNIRRTKLWSN